MIILLAAALAAAPAAHATTRRQPPAAAGIALRQAVARVSQAKIHATIETLVGFGTRHTLSSQTDPRRGIGAALHWIADEFGRDSTACGGCLAIVTPEQEFTGTRSPAGVKVHDVVAIQRGSGDPKRVVIITGHVDSRVTDVMNASADAPGANDDGSGTAAVIEAARVLSHYKFSETIVYAALMGEEQGLYGGKTLADYAKAQGWQVIASLNNDIIGSSCGSDGLCDAAHVRIFSEGPRADSDARLRAQQRSLGGENDSPSRNLSRFIDTLADRIGIGLDVRQIWRSDRYGRGGDHLPMLDAGFPAVRFTVAIENYNWQHQDLRTDKGVAYGDTIDHMDFPYLRKVVQLNVAALFAIAIAPPPPEPKVEGAVSSDTTLSWAPVPGAAAYIVRWRPTDVANWQQSLRVPGSETSRVLKHIRVDDWVFGVSSVSAEGDESPVASALPGGAYKPYVPAPPTPPRR
jgi:hypothetical protein